MIDDNEDDIINGEFEPDEFDEDAAKILPSHEMMKLDKDLLQAVALMGPGAIRALVYLYYLFQEDRKRTANQLRALVERNEPSEVIKWFVKCANVREDQAKIALQRYSETIRIGRWTMGLYGFGPVISAGLAAHIDINKPTVGHIYRFAGWVPGQRWRSKEEAAALAKGAYAQAKKVEGIDNIDLAAARIIADLLGRRPANFLADAKRLSYKKKVEPKRDKGGNIILTSKGVRSATALCPWNQGLRSLCWKVGDCILKFSKREKSFYGPLFREHWEKEKKRNEAGEFAEQAAGILEGTSGKKAPGKSTEAYKWYAQGKLPKAHILSRSKRWVAKLFLAHWHYKARSFAGLKTAKPYALDHLGHTHFIEPPPDVD